LKTSTGVMRGTYQMVTEDGDRFDAKSLPDARGRRWRCVGRRHRVHPIAAVQTEYSLWTRNAEIAVLDACRTMADPAGYALGARHIAISTAGWVPGIERLAEYFDTRPLVP